MYNIMDLRQRTNAGQNGELIRTLWKKKHLTPPSSPRLGSRGEELEQLASPEGVDAAASLDDNITKREQMFEDEKGLDPNKEVPPPGAYWALAENSWRRRKEIGADGQSIPRPDTCGCWPGLRFLYQSDNLPQPTIKQFNPAEDLDIKKVGKIIFYSPPINDQFGTHIDKCYGRWEITPEIRKVWRDHGFEDPKTALRHFFAFQTGWHWCKQCKSEYEEFTDWYCKKIREKGLCSRIISCLSCGLLGGKKTRKRRKRKSKYIKMVQKTKRRRRRRTRNKKGGIRLFSRRRKPKTAAEIALAETDEERKLSILTNLLNGDKYKAQNCLQINEYGKACQLDKKKNPGGFPKSCIRSSNLNSSYGKICKPILKRAVEIFKAEKEFIERRRRIGAGKRRRRRTKNHKSKKLKKTKRRQKRK